MQDIDDQDIIDYHGLTVWFFLVNISNINSIITYAFLLRFK